MPSIPAANARILKRVDIQHLDAARKLPAAVGSNGDFKDDTLRLLLPYGIDDDVFRNIIVDTEGDAEVLVIGALLTANLATSFSSVDDASAQFAFLLEIFDDIRRVMDGDNDQVGLQISGKWDQIVALYGAQAFEGAGAPGLVGLNTRILGANRVTAGAGLSPTLLLSLLDQALKRCVGDDIVMIGRPEAITFLENAAMLAAGGAPFTNRQVPGIGLRPVYKGVTMYFNENLAISTIDPGPPSITGSNVYIFDRTLGIGFNRLENRKAQGLILAEVQDPLQDLDRIRGTWDAGAALMYPLHASVLINVPHIPLT